MAKVIFNENEAQDSSREGSFWTDGSDVYILAQTGPGLFSFISLSNGNRYKERVEFDKLEYSIGSDGIAKRVNLTRVTSKIEIEP